MLISINYMKNLNFEGLSTNPLDNHEDTRQDEDEFSIETEEGIIDPLEAGHREADRIIRDRVLKKARDEEEARKEKRRQEDMEEDRKELEDTYRRF